MIRFVRDIVKRILPGKKSAGKKFLTGLRSCAKVKVIIRLTEVENHGEYKGVGRPSGHSCLEVGLFLIYA